MIVNANSIVQHVIQNKNRIIKHVNVNVKIIVSANKNIVGILAHVFVTESDEIGIVTDILSTKQEKYYSKKPKKNPNVTSTVPTNCRSEKVRVCYILHTIWLVIILVLIIIWKIMYFKKFVLKLVRVIISRT